LKIKLEPEIIKKIKELCRTGLKHFQLTNLEYPALLFLGVNFRHLVTPKKSSGTHTKDFCERKASNSWDFNEQILETIGSSRLSKYSRIFKIFFLSLSPVAKFGYFLLWMITSVA
jgi:hypothetical protein